MSYSACANSALLAPASYPEGAIGNVIYPILDTAVKASGATIDAFTPFTLPKGIWLVTGALVELGGNVITNSTVDVEIDGVLIAEYSYGGDTDLTNNISCVVESDGTNVLGVTVTATVTAAANWNVVGNVSLISVVRIA